MNNVYKLVNATARLSHCYFGVGAVITDPSGKVVGKGYVTVPSDFRDCPRRDIPHPNRAKDYSDCVSTHAEINALRDAESHDVNLEGCLMYVSWQPCIQCVCTLTAHGIDYEVLPESVQVTYKRRGKFCKK
jgi:deoxycytidylate deaminase